MSNLYDKGREGFLSGEIVWHEGKSIIKVAAVRGYTFAVGHKFFSEVTGAGGTVVATHTLANLTNINGVADADDFAFLAVPEGLPIPYLVIYQASAVTGGADLAASQQRLITFLDRGPGIPVVPNGQNIKVAFSPGSDRIFRF